MDKENILRLTNEIYKLTLLFPKREPLRYKLREAGTDLLVEIVSWNKEGFSNASKNLISTIEQKLEVLKTFFALAKEQNWVKEQAILDLIKEYQKVEEEMAVILTVQKIEFPNRTIELPNRGLEEKIEVKEQEKPRQEEKQEPKEPEPVICLPAFGFGLDKQEPGVMKQESDIKLDKRQKKVLKILQEKKEVQIGQLSKKFPQVSRRTLLRDLEKLSQLGFVARQGDGRGVYYRFQLQKV